MKLKCITILIAALTLSSCTLLETQRPEPFSADAFKTSRKGVVFFSIAEGEEENFLTFKFEKSLVFHLVKIGDEHKLPYRIAPCQGFISHRLRDYSSDNLLFLDPGVYYIDFIQRMPKPHGYNQILHRWYPSPGLKNTIIQYGAFEVKAGEIINLGALHIPTFKTYNDTKKIIEDITQSSFPYLLQQMKPGKFYGKGSIVSYNKNKTIELIEASEVKNMQKTVKIRQQNNSNDYTLRRPNNPFLIKETEKNGYAF